MNSFRPALALRAVSLLACLPVLAACNPFTTPQAGRAHYDQNCAACHGTDGRGGAHIPDLTTIALRADGQYPQAMVLDKLDGYARGEVIYSGTQMPDFGDLLTGRLTRVQTDRGLSRPLPERLVAIDAYLQSIQRGASDR